MEEPIISQDHLRMEEVQHNRDIMIEEPGSMVKRNYRMEQVHNTDITTHGPGSKVRKEHRKEL